MISKVLKTLCKHKMLENTKKIIVGFSGGADSVTLTHILLKISEKENFSLEAVHINHGIRGEEAKRDENFVRDFCKKFGIKLTVKNISVTEVAKKLKIGIEEAGRKTRYEIFKEIAEKYPNSKIATAHTLSDNIETFIMRLVSGSSLTGICGIPPLRQNIIRPLIEVKREEIEKYCKENNLSYVNDSSNFERNYTRNKIRLDIIPHLKNLNPSFEESVRRLISSLRNDEIYLENITKKTLETISYSEIPDLPDCLKNRALIKILKSFTNGRIEKKHIEDLEKIIKNGKGNIYIPGGKVLKYSNGKLVSKNIKETEEKRKWEYLFKPLNNLTEIKANITVDIIDINEYRKIEKDYSQNAIDLDKIPYGSVFRNRRSRDKFKFKKRKITKTIKKIFSEMKIKISEREKIPLLAFENEIIWAENLGVSKNYAPDKNTKKIALIKLKKYNVI